MMLAWLGKPHGREDLAQAANWIDRSVDNVLQNPAARTAGLQGTVGCGAFAGLVADRASNG